KLTAKSCEGCEHDEYSNHAIKHAHVFWSDALAAVLCVAGDGITPRQEQRAHGCNGPRVRSSHREGESAGKDCRVKNHGLNEAAAVAEIPNERLNVVDRATEVGGE